MSASAHVATVLAILIQRMEAPEWDGWMPGSLSVWGKGGNRRVGSVVSPILPNVVMWN
jgi:hypothetical protein